MINKKINNLIRKNYTSNGPPMRRFDNPFYIPSEQRLLYDILNNGGIGNKKTTAYGISDNNNRGDIDEDGEDGDGDGFDEPITDPSFSISSNYYQSEVYKIEKNRKAFGTDEINKEYSDERHLVAYNADTNTLSIAMRGTDPSSLDDWLTNFSMIYRSEKGRLTDWFSSNPKVKEGLELFGIPFLEGLLGGGGLIEEELEMIEAFKNLDGLDEATSVKSKYNFEYHKQFLDKVLKFYGPDVRLKLIGHSKGGAEAKMLLAYLKKELPFKSDNPEIIPNNIKAYTYNSLPFNWKSSNTDPDLYPVKTSGDPVAVNINNNHPNLRIIKNNPALPNDRFKPDVYLAHLASNFNYDYRKYPTLREKQDKKIRKKIKKKARRYKKKEKEVRRQFKENKAMGGEDINRAKNSN